MRIFASRAAAELERRHQAAARRRSRARVIDADAERRRVGLAAYFTVSESLTNACRYAGADAVTVRVAPVGDALLVEVVDDGSGGADPASGTGLRGLADRIETLGGRLEIHSPPGAGTRVSARLPLRTGG